MELKQSQLKTIKNNNFKHCMILVHTYSVQGKVTYKCNFWFATSSYKQCLLGYCFLGKVYKLSVIKLPTNKIKVYKQKSWISHKSQLPTNGKFIILKSEFYRFHLISFHFFLTVTSNQLYALQHSEILVCVFGTLIASHHAKVKESFNCVQC